MRKFLLFVSIVIAGSASAQLTQDSILIGDHYRVFHYQPPTTQLVHPSLLFLMHGSGGKGQDMVKPASRLQAVAEKENLVIVYPDAYLHYWNECRKASTAVANKENIDENAFFEAMINYFIKLYQVNPQRVFAAGLSGGGHMAYKLGLTMPETIHAITAIVANLPDSASCDCTLSGKPLPVMIINGTNDQINPYLGGEMFVNNASFGVVKSSEQSFQYWAHLAGYSGKPVFRNLPDTNKSNDQHIESYTFKKNKQPEIVLLKVVNGRHEYPSDIDAILFTWEFFKRQ